MIPNPLRRVLPAAALAVVLGACADADPTGPSARAGGIHRNDVSAAAWNGNIRIGVVPAASAVTLGSAADWTVTNGATGTVLLSGTGGVSATVTLVTGSTSETRFRLQVMCSSAASVAAAQAAAEAAGHPTHTEPVPAANCTRLYIGSFPSDASFSIRNTYRNQLIADGFAGTDSFWRLVTIITGTTEYRVDTGAEQALSSGPVVLSSSDGLVTIAGVRYRGVAEVRVNSAGTLAGINEVPMEQYLYGVVPRELPPTVYDELEAQKAQAIAARTYGMRGMGKRSSDGYDMLATTTDQVYGGYDAEHPVSNRAVDETNGLVATYNGLLIEALFFSTSGGATANNEDVYNSAPVPYLRGVLDSQRGSSGNVLDSLKNAHGAQKLRGMRNGDFEGDWSRYHRWSFEWTADEISRAISAYAGQPVGRVLAINVLERSSSGRVKLIEYVTEAGTFTDTKDRIRSSLRYINATGAQASLLSTLFVIDPVVDRRTGEVTGFTAYGGGWGHGVGLCQTGAMGMAVRGASYERILHHYYTGIELTRWY